MSSWKDAKFIKIFPSPSPRLCLSEAPLWVFRLLPVQIPFLFYCSSTQKVAAFGCSGFEM